MNTTSANPLWSERENLNSTAMNLWPAFILGLIGSLHCAGMCGPLALALPPVGNSRASFVAGRLAYNAGRVTTYCFLGALFGLVGLSFALAGLQRWVSIGAGAAILIGFLASSRLTMRNPVSRAVGWVRSGLGTLNGFLPCGLVYVACAGAAATGGFVSGLEYMAVFGLGTIPMLLSLGLAGRMLGAGFHIRFQRLIPVSVLVLGLLLVLRGLSLGVPYLSPDLGSHNNKPGCQYCH